MKKLLFALTALVVSLTTFAENGLDQDWVATFEPVTDSTELKGIHTAAAADGSVYVSSTYNQAFTFAGKEIADPEGLTSALIVKYDKDGKELWAANMVGNAVVYALDTDAEGTLYAAGNFMDKVEYTGADGVKAEMTGSTDAYTAFIAKVSADGKFQQVKTLASTANETVAASMMYFPMTGDMYVTPRKIQVEGDRIYVSVNYAGDVAELSWKGSYINVSDFMYMDNKNVGLFAMNKADFSEAKSIATVQNTETVSYNQYYADAFDFTVENGTVYAGFIGFGNLTMQANGATNDFKFNVAEDESGNKEHAFVLATIGESVTTKVYHAANHDKDAKPYNLFMNANSENLIIGGTFYGELPFDNQKTTGELASAVFMASVKKADGTVNNAFVNGQESGATCMTVDNESAILSSTVKEVYLMNLETNEVATQGASTYACIDAVEGISKANVYCVETTVYVNGIFDGAYSIEEIIRPAQPENGIIYNLLGQPVNENYKGIVIKNGKKYIQK